MTWAWSGDRAILRTFDGDLIGANAAARALAAAVHDAAPPHVEDVVIGARTTLVLLEPGTEPARALLDLLDAPPDPRPAADARAHTFRVTYDGEDLDEVAARAGLSRDEAIALHAAGDYTVAFLGFSPGFPYLVGLDPRLHAPRLASPRARVPAGSVAVAGSFAGVYPSATPGGWRLLGRTDATLFDPARAEPATLRPGDRVRFEPA